MDTTPLNTINFLKAIIAKRSTLKNTQIYFESTFIPCLKRLPLFFQGILFFAILISIGILGNMGSSNNSAAKEKTSKPAITVAKATAYKRRVPTYLQALGSVIPFYSVAIKPQVNGQLTEVLFTEGQSVKKGDLLATIYSKPYEAQLTQAEGQLERDRALLSNAERDLKRYESLYKQDSVSQQVFDTQKSLVKQYQGIVKADEGQVENARVNLSYCRITAPIDGRVGLLLITPGNLIQTSDATGLVIINTFQPISVDFSIPEDNIPEVIKRMDINESIKVEAFNRGQSQLLETGKLVSIDNQVDSGTGTVKLRAEFANADNILFPNQFVNVRLLIAIEDSVVIPTSAIQNGSNRPFVYLLQKDSTVKVMPVTLGVTIENETIVTNGLEPGQEVVTEGLDKLTNGAKVLVSSP